MIDYMAANGTVDLSLRRLAAGIGTSHRMLIYHFGAKENLLVEVIKAVEQRQRDALADLDAEDPVELGRRFWHRLTEPALEPNERLFFEMYGRALQGDPAAVSMLDGVVEDWITPAAELAVRHGVRPALARATARLGLAVTRGLLLDLLATGDRDGVDEAMELFLTRYAELAPDPDR